MEDIKSRIDEEYIKCTIPLENHTGRTNVISGMTEYLKILGSAITKFELFSNSFYKEIQVSFPEKKDATREYLIEMHNKLVNTYKPK